jgi:hypothetical protein
MYDTGSLKCAASGVEAPSMSITTDSDSWIGCALTDSEDRKLGTIEEIYCDEQTGQPLWMVVKTGRFATKRSFVPLRNALPTDIAIVTPYDRHQIDDAPKLDAADELPDGQVRDLYRYYGLPFDAQVDSDQPGARRETPAERVLKYLM